MLVPFKIAHTLTVTTSRKPYTQNNQQMYGACMSDEMKPKNLHVLFRDPAELERLKRIRGKMEWKPWLLTLPDQFRAFIDTIELWKRRAGDFEKENNDLKERIRVLQEQIGDA